MTWADDLRVIELPGSEIDESIRDGREIIGGVVEPFSHTPAKRTRMNTRAENARIAIPRLPEAGETLHGWMNGSWDAWRIVPRVLELAAPAVVTELNIATLGFNKDNTQSLLDLIDSGKIGRVTFLCSHFYKTHEGDVVALLSTELQKRGGRMAAARSHAKVILFELDDGRCLVWHSSANLRSCKDMEQWDLTHDRDLLEYDRRIMLQLMDQVGA